MTTIPQAPLATATAQQLKRHRLAIYTLSCVLSALLFCAFATTNDLLNDDGINYIYAAHALAEGLPEQAKSYRPETLFYRQITLLASLTNLELYTSAQLLSLFWQAALACGFIAIVRSFDASLQSQIIALAVFFSMASLNHLRPDIIRGFGFWALQLWAVWAGLAFIKNKTWWFALLWLGFSVASVIYRTEGIVYLLLIPFAALFGASYRDQGNALKSLKLGSAILLGSAFLWLLLSPELQPASAELTPTAGFSSHDKLRHELTTLRLAASNFEQLKDAISAQMPNKWAQRSINDVLIGGFIFHVLLTLLKASNMPLMALSLYRNGVKRPFFSDPRHQLLASYLLIGVMVGLLSVYNKYFVSQRYLMLTAILISVPIALVLSHTYQRYANSALTSARLWKCALFALPLLACLYPLSRQHDDKLYIQAAGEWVKTHLDDGQKIYFNSQKVAFYSDDYTNDSFKSAFQGMPSLLQEGYQYAVLYETGGAAIALQQQPPVQALKTFHNRRGRSVKIYQLTAPGHVN